MSHSEDFAVQLVDSTQDKRSQSLAKQHGAKGVVSGLIRDLRSKIGEAFGAKSNFTIGREDVILSGGMGYRFSERVTVRFEFRKVITDIADTAELTDVRNVFEVHHDEAARRRTWIVMQLQVGVQLKAPMVTAQFNRTKKTAQRDLNALRDEGRIEFVGDRRTGYYRLLRGKRSD